MLANVLNCSLCVEKAPIPTVKQRYNKVIGISSFNYAYRFIGEVKLFNFQIRQTIQAQKTKDGL